MVGYKSLLFPKNSLTTKETTEAGLDDYSGASQSTVIPNNSTITRNTCGNMMEINCFETLNKYISDTNESPVAKYRSAIANFALAGIASLNECI